MDKNISTLLPKNLLHFLQHHFRVEYFFIMEYFLEEKKKKSDHDLWISLGNMEYYRKTETYPYLLTVLKIVLLSFSFSLMY